MSGPDESGDNDDELLAPVLGSYALGGSDRIMLGERGFRPLEAYFQQRGISALRSDHPTYKRLMEPSSRNVHIENSLRM